MAVEETKTGSSGVGVRKKKAQVEVEQNKRLKWKWNKKKAQVGVKNSSMENLQPLQGEIKKCSRGSAEKKKAQVEVENKNRLKGECNKNREWRMKRLKWEWTTA
jgi:hypothetical protein